MKKILRVGILTLSLFMLSSCNLLGGLSLYKSIDFDSNFGTQVEPIIKFPGASVREPTPPTREHYTFGGWYSDRDLTEPYVFDKMPKESILLYAKWNGDIDETPSGLRLLVKDNGEYGVEGYVGTNPDLVIPESYNDIPITSIEILAFDFDDVIETIDIPNTVTLIRYGAFSNVMRLHEIIIPSSVVELEECICVDSRSITHIEFESDSQLKIIGELAFFSMHQLMMVNIPASVEKIEDYAFFDCPLLKYVIFDSEDHLTFIGKGAFGDTNLNFIIIPASVITISDYAFSKDFDRTIDIYVRQSAKPDGWAEQWYGGEANIEWGSTRTVIMVTYQEPDGTILFKTLNISGTQYKEYSPGDIDGQFIGWYADSELTVPLDITTYPEESFTIYGKIEPSD